MDYTNLILFKLLNCANFVPSVSQVTDEVLYTGLIEMQEL